MIIRVCLYFYCKATEESFVLEVVFGEWAKTVVGNLKKIVEAFKIESDFIQANVK
ncbi:MAG: hypothetical protein K0R36_229 [Chryseobacterium sp.]|jgi:hypothetical protein|nr:hypothetical protein [Chryseobacterium sp.]